MMAKHKKATLVKQAVIDSITGLEPIFFNIVDGKPVGTYSGAQVQVVEERQHVILDNDLWFCKLDMAGAVYMADPRMRFTAEFLFDMNPNQLARLAKLTPNLVSNEGFKGNFLEVITEGSPYLQMLLHDQKKLETNCLSKDQEYQKMKAKLETEQSRYSTLKLAYERQQAQHTEQIAELTNEIGKMKNQSKQKGETENKKLKDEMAKLTEANGKLSTELSRTEEQLKSKADELEASTEELKAAAEELKAKENGLTQMAEELKTAGEELDRLKAEIDSLKTVQQTVPDDRDQRIKELEEQLEKVTKESEDNICLLIEQLKRYENGSDAANIFLKLKKAQKPAFSIRRHEPDTLSSDWFTAERYKVVMSGDFNRLLITPDEAGRIKCKDYTLKIPGMGKLHPHVRTYCDVVMDPETETVVVCL